MLTNKTDHVHISSLFRSDYAEPNDPKPPPTTVYTSIDLGTASVLFGVIYLAYALVLVICKCLTSSDFKSATKWKKVQHILEALNMPESFSDWDSDLELDIHGLRKKWGNVLGEMLLMVAFQFVTNMSTK